jgi:hypothetical protein
MPKVKSKPARHVQPASHRGYCSACRVNYYQSNPGPRIITYSRPGGRNFYKGGVPSLKYFAAKRVNSRSLFKYKRPQHSY